jgi:trigger factor
MKIEQNNLDNSQVEFTVELTVEEFEPYIQKGADKIAQEIKIDGFRQGKAPFGMIKDKVGELTILEEAANIAIRKTLSEVLAKDEKLIPIGQPDVRITKLAPGNPLEYKIIVSKIPEVKVGDYKNIKISKDKAEVTDADLDRSLGQLREMRVQEKISEKEISENDKIVIDLDMFLDNVPLEGGQGKDVAVILGKNHIVPGFDNKIIGAKKGDTREFTIVYPPEYHQANLAGKNVEFRVVVKEVFSREIPEADEEFAKQLGFNNLEDLKDNFRKSLKEEKEYHANQKSEADMLSKIVEKSRYGDFPEFLVNEEAHALLHEIEHDIERQGGKFADYLSSIKKTHDEMLLDLAPEAVKRIKTILAIREIAKLENIEVSEKDIEDEVEKLLKQYKGYEKVEEKIKGPEYRAQLHSVVLNRKVIDKLKELNSK